MRVRLAGAGDLAAVMALERAAEEAPHWAETVYAAMMGEGAGQERVLLVAEAEAARVVGFGVASVVRPVGSGEVENLVVAAGMRRRGAGRALCEGLLAWAGAQGATEMNLEVRVGNVGARALYDGLGFSEVGRRRGYYGGKEDAVLMRRTLRGDGAEES